MAGGEFAAEDAGSTLRVRVELERTPLSRWAPGPLVDGAPSATYDPARTPLETAVEAEDPEGDTRLGIEAGAEFVRLLRRHGVGRLARAFADAYPVGRTAPVVAAHPETARLLRLARSRVPDGLALARDVAAAGGELSDVPAVGAADRAAATAAAHELVTWLARRAGSVPAGGTEPGRATAWQSERMEHAFAVSGSGPRGETVLVATEYASGHLDWQAFDHAPGAGLGADPGGVTPVLVREAIPRPCPTPACPCPAGGSLKTAGSTSVRSTSSPRTCSTYCW